jgi:N6-adenosine-specific RNA methylase IME4
MKYHPIADIFPMFDKKQLQELSDDIQANGLKEPIWIYEDKILDGRNRFEACKLAGVEHKFKSYGGNSPTSFVISLNLKRRHLTDSQKACVSAEALPWLEKEAEKRLHLSKGRGVKGSEIVHDLKGRSDDQAGSLTGVSGRYVADAKAIKEESPEEFEAIKRGEKTISEVKKKIKKTETLKRIKEFPSEKYRVIYADPPWSYNDKCDDGSIQSGGAEKHYPSMTIPQLCDLPIENICDENAVLFMWVTSPLLFECQPIFESWGFRYKASFVWDKIKHNMGHYNSVRHEFLLICTKGSCTPDKAELFDSVQSIERTKHSEKPEAFRKIIDTLYPHGKRIELFARRKSDGWDNWGTGD